MHQKLCRYVPVAGSRTDFIPTAEALTYMLVRCVDCPDLSGVGRVAWVSTVLTCHVMSRLLLLNPPDSACQAPFLTPTVQPLLLSRGPT